ncbi:hypothetical protein QOZ80_5AG0389540 [Eleusine coracana subsp. coracana]|nr:hypothetical protein QOZ80_5AG0389540 [Eleusine coracana subsp. coracana]
MALDAPNLSLMLKGEWSSSEMEMAKSLIVSHNNNNNNAGNGDGIMRNKQKDIVDVLHAEFPWKDRHQVTNLYVDIMVEVIQSQEKMGTTGPTSGVVHHVNNKFGISVEGRATDNLVKVLSPLNEVESGARKMVEKQSPRWPSTNEPERHMRKGRFWSTEEHKLFLHGLRTYGRGNWKDISKNIVKTRTPVQVSSHAQKYFRRVESPAPRQRHSINDVGLYDAEPWATHANSSGFEVVPLPSGSYNSNFGVPFDQRWSQQASFMHNNAKVLLPGMYHACEASTSQSALTDHEQMGYSTAIAPVLEATNNLIPRDQQGATTPQN